MSKYMSLEQTIRKLGTKGVSQPLEKDMNDQVHAGSYSTKHFEVSAPAQKLYASLPKDTDPDKAEKSVQLHDKLFAIHKNVAASERSTSSDVEAAQKLHDEIMSLAKEMGLEKEHSHVKDSLEYIKKYVDTQTNVKDDIKPEDVAKRYATPTKDYQNDVKADADIDNIQKFRISRDKKAQRKLKIIDDEFNLGVENMDRIEKVSVSFLEALKQVKSNAEALEEKKKMTKADIAALREPKGKFDEKDLAALRAGEHKKVKEEVEKEEKNEKEEDDDGWYAHKEMHGSKAVSKEDWKKGYRLNAKGEKVKKSNEEVEQVDEAQFITIQKGMEKKRVRNNPVEIMQARKDGWAIQEEVEQIDELTGYRKKKLFGTDPLTAVAKRAFNRMKLPPNDGGKLSPEELASNTKNSKVSRMAIDRMEEEVETVEEGNEMKNLAKSQKAAVVKREVQQKKAMYAKKDAVDKQKFSKSMQKIHAGDEVEMNGEQIDEAAFKLTDAHKSAITKHLKNNYGKGKVTFHSEHGGHFATHSDGIQSTVHHAEMKNGKLTLSHFMTMDEEIEQLEEGVGVRNQVRKAILAGAKTSKGDIEHGINKDIITKLKGKEAGKTYDTARKMVAKESFMERAIAILGEEFADMSFEQLVEEVKKARGRPRKNPLPDPNAPKRGRGRPRKDAGSSSSSSAAKPDEAGDREHIVMALRKSISLRGEHGVKFADGSTHKISAEHAQKALKMHDSLNKPSEKMTFQRKLGASHSSFKKALEDKNPGSEETKKTGITLAKRAEL